LTVEVLPLLGLPEVRPGDDLVDLLADATAEVGLREGDVLAVTQKIVSKAEGRLVDAPDGKEAWIERESRRIVARRGELVIAETHHGLVCANAGIDASNIPDGFLALLPEDPDASAERIREGLASRTGAAIGVVITDTFGRPWRRGLVEVAIGCSGFPALLDLRGTKDQHGRVLDTTVLALADEVASAAGLVMGKTDGVPAAIVRGLSVEGRHVPAAAVIRPREEDLFRHSPLEAISARRTVREFTDEPVPREVLKEAVAAALTAPVPHGSRHRTKPWTWVVLDSAEAKRSLLDAMAEAWVRDLRGDRTAEDVIARRLARSDSLLGRAPALAVPFLSLSNADAYPDIRRQQAERDMFVLATGAAVQSFMLALHAQGVGSAWVSSSLFCQEEAASAVGLDRSWLAMGVVAAGRPIADPPARAPIDLAGRMRFPSDLPYSGPS
jgi:dehydro coenzyme F420 reductase / coenzyme F420-0:L-glutamate ligase / coenzyme F420-1:gamma-L-glutamate ligase